jgi:hypothetical protein
MNKPERKEKPKDPSVDMDARARITLAATSDPDESENVESISSEKEVTDKDVKDYLADVLTETKRKSHPND